MHRRLHALVPAGLLGVLAVCWVLLTPPGAGPDEPSHLYRAGELAEGHWHEWLVTSLDPPIVAHRLPAEYAVPEPGCYAQQPSVPVDCAVGTEAQPDEHGRVLVATTSDNYPAWGHVVPAIATWLPGDGGIWAARVASAAVTVGIVAATVVALARYGDLAAAGAFVAVTPMAWSTFAQVNPSALATAGGLALWATLLTRRPGWLMAVGWTALALPRRDGLTWACLIVGTVLLVDGRTLFAGIWRERRRLAGPLGVVALSTVAAVAWSLTSPARVIRLGGLAPLVVVAAWGARSGWDRLAGRRSVRAVYATALGAVGLAGVAGSFVVRPGGWDAGLTRAVIGETRRHLTEAIGVLGWLDVPLPRWVPVGWGVLVTVLGWSAVRARCWSRLGLAGGAFTLALVTMWAFELQEGSAYGRYWQGRYSLPLLVGVPLALAVVRPARDRAAGQPHGAGTDPTGSRATALGLIVGALAMVNVAAWAAVRRWAVGIHGTHRPWKWGAELFAVHPLPVLVLHAVASIALAWAVYAQRFVPPSST